VITGIMKLSARIVFPSALLPSYEVRERKTTSYAYDPTEGGIKFTIAYDLKVSGLMKLFSPIVVNSMHKELRKALGNLKSILEAQS